MVLSYGNGTASYDIVYRVFRELRLCSRSTVVLDLTYGVGRFYRKVKRYCGCYLIGVDITQHEWEVEPDEFYRADACSFTYTLPVSIVVVDPPWSASKRGAFPKGLGISHLPYHVKTDDEALIRCALHKATALGVPLLARWKKPLDGAKLLAVSNVTIMGNKGNIYYSVVYPPEPG